MPLTRLGFFLHQLLRRLWVRAAAFALLGVAAAIGGRFVGPFLPEDVMELSGARSVRGLLNILASSMLAVTTFSLSIMVQAYGAAAAAVTPRAVELLLEDRTSQTVLSTFLGAFLFALVGLIALEGGVYGDPGRVVLFLATIAVTIAVVIAMIGWISHLTGFGRVGDTTRRVEEAASAALHDRLKRPALGGIVADNGVPPGLVPVMAGETGYLRHVDMPHLQDTAKGIAGRDGRPVLYLNCLPGTFVHPAAPLLWRSAWIEGGPEDPDALDDRLREAFTVGDARSFDQDPRFGLCVLAEIASRALSPAINDPGTAIDVLGRAVRVLSDWPNKDPAAPAFPLVGVPPLTVADLMSDVFPIIAADAGGMFPVQMRLQKALLALAQIAPVTFGFAAAEQSARALVEAQAKLTHETDLVQLQTLAEQIARLSGSTGGHARPL